MRAGSRKQWLTTIVVTVTVALMTRLCLAGSGKNEDKPVRPASETREPHDALQEHFVPDQVVVKLKVPTNGQLAAAQASESVLQRLQDRYGLESVDPAVPDAEKTQGMQALGTENGPRRSTSGHLAQYHLFQTKGDVLDVCAALSRDPDVEFAQPNYTYELCAAPNDPHFPDQYAHQLIQMAEAWDISTGSRDVVVGILDTGVDIEHPDLKDNIWTNEGEIPDNGVDDDENGYIDDVHGWNFESHNNEVIPQLSWYEIEGHGTMVSGVVAAVGNNGEGVSGVNWACSIMPLRMSIYVTSVEVAGGLEYAADNGADIVNMSFGGDVFGPEGDAIVKEAIDYAYDRGVLLVASAGNDDAGTVNYPAGYYNVMAVSSTNGEDTKTDHSMYGPWVDVAAPGTDIVTTDLGGDYIYTAGTSFSSPYVAGVAALVLSKQPELTHTELRAVVENTVDPVYYGQVNPNECYLGTGRVNAYTALLTSDIHYPLAEIVAPQQAEQVESDANTVDAVLFVHGDSYRLEYSVYGNDDWVLASEGVAPADANGLIEVAFAAPNTVTYDLRLSATSDGLTHTDRKVFTLNAVSEQEGWPKEHISYGGVICMDVTGNGRNEIIHSSYSELDVWDEDGNSLPGWPVVAVEAYDSPVCAVGDIDGDGDFEIVATYSYDDLVYAWHAESGQMVEGDWPVAVGDWNYGDISGNPVLADLDGDGDSEIIVALDSSSYSSDDNLYALQGDGSVLWERRHTSIGPMSVADFDLDGNVEIAFSGYGPGMNVPYTYIFDHNGQQLRRWRGGSYTGTIATDLDGDGQSEMIFCTDDSVQAVRIDGSTVWETQITDSFSEYGTMSAGDLNNDGRSEIYISSYVERDEYGFVYTLVHGLDYEGRLLTEYGYPKPIMGITYGTTLLIGDVDADAQQELIATAWDTPVMAWESDGSTTPGFPMYGFPCEEDCSGALADLDQDGDIELLLPGYDYQLHVADLPGTYDSDAIDWGGERHDPQCSGSTAKGPKLDPIDAPSQIAPGQRLELKLSGSSTSGQALHILAGNLPPGAYFNPDTLTVLWKPTSAQAYQTFVFNFLVTDGIRQVSRSVSIEVVPNAIYDTNMDTDPGWQLDEGWAWGTPTQEPSSAHTGQSVLGYALDGDYENNLTETRYATVGPIDCQEFENIRLGFWRWLGVEAPYDFANIQVSNDGVNWTDLWTTGSAHVFDQAWQHVEYVVPSAVGDHQATLYFRWGMGPTDDIVTFTGWSIDDVQITGDAVE